MVVVVVVFMNLSYNVDMFMIARVSRVWSGRRAVLMRQDYCRQRSWSVLSLARARCFPLVFPSAVRMPSGSPSARITLRVSPSVVADVKDKLFLNHGHTVRLLPEYSECFQFIPYGRNISCYTY